jgi:hypothetical protein
MKKYNLIVLAGYTHWTVAVFAEKFHTTTNNSNSSGFYSFYDGNTVVACYPIEKTIITGIEDLEDE